MTGWIIFGTAYAIIPSAFNIGVTLYKRKKIINKSIKVLEDNGYKINKRFKNSILNEIMKGYHLYFKEYIAFHCDLYLFTWFPFIRLYDAYLNIKFLSGDYKGGNEIYSDLRITTGDVDIIDNLEKLNLIKKDNEKKNCILDRDNESKESERKYENIKVDSEIHTFSKNDKLDELYAKMAELEEIIQRKESNEQKSNEDIQVLGLKKKEQK